ncbi:MAG: glycosyltransferase WbsX family protein [Thermoguttaceae bacterium]
MMRSSVAVCVTKYLPSLLSCLLLVWAPWLRAAEGTAEAAGRLEVVNGDFSDLAGMAVGQGGWYGGLPKGWQGSENTYALQVDKDSGNPVCNPSTLGFFRQNVGVLDRAADVVLSFDVSQPWKPDSAVNAAILDGDFVPLAEGDFAAGTRQMLVARQVPAGTTILIAFATAQGTPGLDNVSVSTRPSDAPSPAVARRGPASDPAITVACYYFGNYHPGDPRNEKSKGKGWSEWELVKAAKPRFPGHHQPNVPLWGYTDESDPKVMAQKIAAAADHGVDAFIFDWYYYNDGPFLDRPIDLGFLKAENNSRLKFSFMWANHDWTEIHPYRRGAEREVLYPGAVTPDTFQKICDHVIGSYFAHPSYWRIDGRPYFSFYDLTTLVESFGGVKATREALDQFRAKAVAAGLPGLHLNAVVWGQAILPGERKPADAARLVKDLGFDSVTSYVWIHHVSLPQLQTDYNEVRDAYFRYWNEAERKFDVPYFPNVTMGWDSSPRAHQDDEFGNFGYPFTNTISGNTPERFKEALAMTRRRLLAQPDGPRIFNINCWNEWTEGSYLEPDTVHGMKYLEAVRDVFGSGPAAP